MRDNRGKWVQGFQGKIGINSALEDVLWALRDVLKLDIDLNITGIEVEMDASQAITLIFTNNYSTHSLSSIISDCWQLLEGCQVSNINHAKREANQWTDLLAKKAFELCNFNYVSLVEPPLFMLQQLVDDSVGVKYPRPGYV